MSQIIAIVLFIIVLFSFAIVIRGDWVINLVPAIRTFRGAHQRWGQLHINRSAIPTHVTVDDLGQRRFEEVNDVDSNEQHILDEVRHKRFGDVMTVVSYKERNLRALTRELRMYSSVFLILLLAGALTNADKFIEKPFYDIAQEVLSYHVVPVLELIMIVYLLIRFIVETQSIQSLLEGE